MADFDSPFSILTNDQMTKWPRLDTFFCEKTIFSCEVFVNRNENVVPLQCQMKEVAEAAIKDKNSLLSKASKLERLALNLEIARINGSKIFL